MAGRDYLLYLEIALRRGCTVMDVAETSQWFARRRRGDWDLPLTRLAADDFDLFEDVGYDLFNHNMIRMLTEIYRRA